MRGSFRDYIAVNLFRVKLTFITTLVVIGPIIFFFVFWMLHEVGIMVAILAGVIVICSIISFAMIFGAFIAYSQQRATIVTMTKQLKPQDLCLHQTREFKLKTNFNRAFYLCKMSCGAIPKCKIKKMEPENGYLMARRGDPWIHGPPCNVEFFLKRKKKNEVYVKASSKLMMPLGMADLGTNYKNMDYVVRYLDRHCKKELEPIDFELGEGPKKPDWLNAEKPMKPDYLEDH